MSTPQILRSVPATRTFLQALHLGVPGPSCDGTAAGEKALAGPQCAPCPLAVLFDGGRHRVRMKHGGQGQCYGEQINEARG